MEPSINQELDLLAEAVSASVSLDDTDGRVLGYSVQTQDADPTRVAAILTRQVPAQVSAWQRLHGVEHATGPVHLPADPEHGMAARLCVPVRAEGRTVALLWVLESSRELTSGEVEVAVAAAARLAFRLSPDELPGQRAVDPGELLRRMSRGEHLATSEPITSVDPQLLSVTVVVPRPPSPGEPARWRDQSHLQRALSAFARSSRAGVAVYAEPDHAALLHVTAKVGVKVDLAAELRRMIPHPAVTGTASTPDIPLALHRARSAARWASLDPGLPTDATWADVGLHALASELPAITGRSGLAPLREHQASGQMLLATLETYLDLAGDAQRTATALHLHRTTLYYRLRRAAEILGLDLADGMTRTRLHLELKQHRLADSAQDSATSR